MKLLKFGTISEQPDGRLLFQHFHVDTEDYKGRGELVLLELAIQRLQEELERFLAEFPTGEPHV